MLNGIGHAFDARLGARAAVRRLTCTALALIVAVPLGALSPPAPAAAAAPASPASASQVVDSDSVMPEWLSPEDTDGTNALGTTEQLWSFDATDTTPSHYYTWCKSGTFKDDFPRDAQGVVMVKYPTLAAPVYNPVTVAQYALHYYELWLHDGNTVARDRFLVHVRWLRDRGMDAQGRYPYTFPTERGPAPWYSAMAQGCAISALARAYVYTGDATYLTAANKAFQPFKKNLADGGVVLGNGTWLEEYPDGYHVLNGAIFAMWGLWDLDRIGGDPAAIEVFEKSTDNLAANLDHYESEGAILYEIRPDRFAHPTYHLVHIRQLDALSVLTADTVFSEYARRWEKSFRAYPAPRFTTRAEYASSRGRAVTLRGSIKYLFRAYFAQRPAVKMTSWQLANPAVKTTTVIPLDFIDGYNAEFHITTSPLWADMQYRFEVLGTSTLAGWGCDYPITASGTSVIRQVRPTLSDVRLVNNPATPNGDGWNDWVYAAYTLGGSEAKTTLRVYDSRGVLRASVPGRVVGGQQAYQWNGVWWTRYNLLDAAGNRLPDGLYRYVVEATNSMGTATSAGQLFVCDHLTTAPALYTRPVLEDVWASPTPFSPNGDGVNDATHFGFTTTENAWITIKVYNYLGEAVTVVNNARFNAGRYYPLWSGRNSAGALLPPGNYVYSVFASGGGMTPATSLASGVVSIR